VPAAAVIPAPIAYINVVAVKKLVVGLVRVGCVSAPQPGKPGGWRGAPHPSAVRPLAGQGPVTVRKSECSKQARAPFRGRPVRSNELAWDDVRGVAPCRKARGAAPVGNFWGPGRGPRVLWLALTAPGRLSIGAGEGYGTTGGEVKFHDPRVTTGGEGDSPVRVR